MANTNPYKITNQGTSLTIEIKALNQLSTQEKQVIRSQIENKVESLGISLLANPPYTLFGSKNTFEHRGLQVARIQNKIAFTVPEQLPDLSEEQKEAIQLIAHKFLSLMK